MRKPRKNEIIFLVLYFVSVIIIGLLPSCSYSSYRIEERAMYLPICFHVLYYDSESQWYYPVHFGEIQIFTYISGEWNLSEVIHITFEGIAETKEYYYSTWHLKLLILYRLQALHSKHNVTIITKVPMVPVLIEDQGEPLMEREINPDHHEIIIIVNQSIIQLC